MRSATIVFSLLLTLSPPTLLAAQTNAQSQIRITNQGSSTELKIGYVAVDRSNPAWVQFNALPANESVQELQELRSKADIFKGEIVTWDEFTKRVHDYAHAAIIKNDYPDKDVADIAVCLIQREPKVPWVITWNGGLAFTDQDYRWTKAHYDSFMISSHRNYTKPPS